MTVETHVTQATKIILREVVLAGNCHTEIEIVDRFGRILHSVFVFGWDRSNWPEVAREAAETETR